MLSVSVEITGTASESRLQIWGLQELLYTAKELRKSSLVSR